MHVVRVLKREGAAGRPRAELVVGLPFLFSFFWFSIENYSEAKTSLLSIAIAGDRSPDFQIARGKMISNRKNGDRSTKKHEYRGAKPTLRSARERAREREREGWLRTLSIVHTLFFS